MTGILPGKPTIDELKNLLAPIDVDARLLHMDLRSANYLCKNRHLVGLIDWSNALIAGPMLELARVAEYGGLSPGFAVGYKMTPDMNAMRDQELGIAYRLYTVVMLCVLFLAQFRLLIKPNATLFNLTNSLLASGASLKGKVRDLRAGLITTLARERSAFQR